MHIENNFNMLYFIFLKLFPFSRNVLGSMFIIVLVLYLQPI